MKSINKYSWILVPLIAFGGIFYPLLGLLVLLIMFVLMVLGLVNGRYWCGNLCPHGSLFDNIINKISFSKTIPPILKSSYFKWGFFIFFMGMFVLRFIRVLDHLGTEKFFANLGFLFVLQYLIMPTIVGISLASFISPRAWCSFCPMGTLAEIMYRLGKVTGLNILDQKVNITAPDKCQECGLCAEACPLDLVPHQNYNSRGQFINPHCMQCAQCVQKCPLDLLRIKTK